MANDVIILNGDYSFIGFTSWRRAIVLIETKKAEIIKESEQYVKTMGGRLINIPIVLRLIKFIRMIYRKEVPFSKKNVLVRDKYTCQYCGRELSKNAISNKEKNFKKIKATIDHLIPVSRGGKSSWDNCVCSCFECNNKKSNRTMSEANMSLKNKPFKPTISEFIKLKLEISNNKFNLDELWS